MTMPNGWGEIVGLGPEYACKDYGKQKHCYLTCKVCSDNFTVWLNRKPAKASA